MNKLLLVALGGAVGSVLRYGIAMTMIQRFGVGFPLGTLTVNAVGSLCIGFFLVFFQQRIGDQQLLDNLHSLILIGVLGGFTTFSTFSLETLQLANAGLWNKALLNIIANIVICLLAVAAGMAVARVTT